MTPNGLKRVRKLKEPPKIDVKAPNSGAEMNDEEKLADCAPAAEGGWRAILFY